MNERELLMILLYAISAASRPESSVLLKEEHLHMKKIPHAKRQKPLPPKKVRRWRHLYEHRDTPIHHHQSNASK